MKIDIEEYLKSMEEDEVLRSEIEQIQKELELYNPHEDAGDRV